MINSIKINNTASYKSATSLKTEKKINLLYGLNGTGKTTLSNFLQDKDKVEFKDCSIIGGESSKILVYNQKFINDNFYVKDNLKGIFTISESNGAAEENIKNAKTEIEEIDNQKRIKEDKLKKIDGSIEKKLLTATNEIWKIKTIFSGGDRILDYCLEGIKSSKSLLFKHIKSLEKSSIKPAKTVDELKKEISQIEGDKAIEIPILPKVELSGLSEIEIDTIFNEVIVGNKDSTVSNLIDKFENSDWVKLGVTYLPTEIAGTEICPFCQQKTINMDLANELKNYFDKTYEDKLSRLRQLKDMYLNIKNNIPNMDTFLTNEFSKAKKIELENSHTKLINTLNKNINAIDSKIKLPSSTINFKDYTQEISNFNELIESINHLIIGHNEKIKNKQAVKDIIKKEFWEIMRWEYDSYILSYEKDLKDLEKDKSRLNESIKKLLDDIKAQNDIIKKNQGKTAHIEEAIKAINYQLILLGLHGFEIKQHENNFYRIIRENEDESQFKSLSEGEKMIISFLYFIELCKGKEDKDETILSKIIVIDDPISSLSHNYIFNIAQLIKSYFFDNSDYSQVFVLTHSMYFFHELCKLKKPKTRKLFRIIKKSDKSSSFLEMKEDEILNDYQAYWKIIKDYENGNAPDNIMANAMRNILEHFFAFVYNEKMKEAIKTIDSNKYGAFLRYVDRESHSDQTNISDIKEIDIRLFKNAFKKVFEDTKNIKHYNKMMDLE